MKIIHYDTGKGLYAPISGRHTLCLCGQSFQDNYKPDSLRYSKDKEKVTCKNCLKKLKKMS